MTLHSAIPSHSVLLGSINGALSCLPLELCLPFSQANGDTIHESNLRPAPFLSSYFPLCPDMPNMASTEPPDKESYREYVVGVLDRAISNGLSDRSTISPHVVRRNLRSNSKSAYILVMVVWREWQGRFATCPASMLQQVSPLSDDTIMQTSWFHLSSRI